MLGTLNSNKIVRHHDSRHPQVPVASSTRHCMQINCLTQTVEHAYFHKWPAGGVVNP